jgi:hypothetical protein
VWPFTATKCSSGVELNVPTIGGVTVSVGVAPGKLNDEQVLNRRLTVQVMGGYTGLVKMGVFESSSVATEVSSG